MKLTNENKAYIDGMSHYGLLYKIRFAPLGDPWFEEETGHYWLKRREELRAKDPDQAVQDSKLMGCG